MRDDDGCIEFDPIPCVAGEGHICLGIYPPGTFCGNTDFGAFVGGCGVGHASTLREAKVLLQEHAVAGIRRRLAAAHAIARHYEQELTRFQQTGLRQIVLRCSARKRKKR